MKSGRFRLGTFLFVVDCCNKHSMHMLLCLHRDLAVRLMCSEIVISSMNCSQLMAVLLAFD